VCNAAQALAPPPLPHVHRPQAPHQGPEIVFPSYLLHQKVIFTPKGCFFFVSFTAKSDFCTKA
jgi:hypothetical protein